MGCTGDASDDEDHCKSNRSEDSLRRLFLRGAPFAVLKLASNLARENPDLRDGGVGGSGSNGGAGGGAEGNGVVPDPR